MNKILNIIHKTIYQFFDVCEDDEEVPMSDKDKLLLEVNKAICNNLNALEHEQISALDKIRAEIIERDRTVKAVRSDNCCFFTAEEVLEIIDKYMAERMTEIDPVDIDKAVEHYEGTLEVLKGVGLEEKA